MKPHYGLYGLVLAVAIGGALWLGMPLSTLLLLALVATMLFMHGGHGGHGGSGGHGGHGGDSNEEPRGGGTARGNGPHDHSTHR